MSMAPLALLAIAALALGCGGQGSASAAGQRTTLIIPSAPEAQAPEPAAPSGFRCEEGTRFEVAGRSYCAYDRPSPWKVAERRCADNGGVLASFDTEETSEALKKALRSPIASGRALWIGLSKPQPRGGWRWVSGDPLGDATWDKGEPNNFGGDEGCAEWLIADGSWNDTRCALEQGYLCQATSAGSKILCPGGKPFSVGGLAYCAHDDATVPWNDAMTACQRDGGTLAVLRKAEESRGLSAAMAARFHARALWIGFTDGAREDVWRWVSGARGDYTAWADGEPNDFHNEDCAEVFADTWTWNDFDCNAPLPSLCEAPRR